MPNAHPHTQILIEKNFIVIFQNLDFSFLLKLKACLTLDTKMECLPSGPALQGEKFRQTIWDKSAQCYWEHPWEKHIENLRNTIGNMVKVQVWCWFFTLVGKDSPSSMSNNPKWFSQYTREMNDCLDLKLPVCHKSAFQPLVHHELCLSLEPLIRDHFSLCFIFH